MRSPLQLDMKADSGLMQHQNSTEGRHRGSLDSGGYSQRACARAPSNAGSSDEVHSGVETGILGKTLLSSDICSHAQVQATLQLLQIGWAVTWL